MSEPVIEVRGLSYRYPKEQTGRLALNDLSLVLERGSRCLLVGRNGAGKSTLLRLLAGKQMVSAEAVRVLGRPAFHDTSLSSRVTYLGSVFPFDVDITVAEILAHRPHADPARRQRLIDILDVKLDWHMHRVSDGQRRRVQILMAMLSPAEVLLLDEVTTDLDLIARADLLAFLRDESETRGATILYASHILDALDGWLTHIALLEAGSLVRLSRIDQLTELAELRRQGVSSVLVRMVERWLRDPASAGSG